MRKQLLVLTFVFGFCLAFNPSISSASQVDSDGYIVDEDPGYINRFGSLNDHKSTSVVKYKHGRYKPNSTSKTVEKIHQHKKHDQQSTDSKHHDRTHKNDSHDEKVHQHKKHEEPQKQDQKHERPQRKDHNEK